MFALAAVMQFLPLAQMKVADSIIKPEAEMVIGFPPVLKLESITQEPIRSVPPDKMNPELVPVINL